MEVALNTFGERLKYSIKHSDYKTIKSFAEHTGLHKGSVTNIVRGVNNPSFDVIVILMKYLNIDAKWLILGETDQSSQEYNKLKKEFEDLKAKREAGLKHSSNRTNPRYFLSRNFQYKLQFS